MDKNKSEYPLVTVQSPAKINLFLKVIKKRTDGYHDLLSLMSPVSLYDTLTIAWGGSRTSVQCAHPDVPEDDGNLAVRAAALFFKESGIPDTVHITIDKQIPVGAGLGGGSGNAGTVLCALNRQYGFPFNKQELICMGTRIGADVPFFIFNRQAIASGIGENLESIDNIICFHVLLVSQPYTVSTARVFKKLNLELTNLKNIIIQSFFDNKRFQVKHLVNDLEAVTAAAHPEIRAVKNALMEHGADGALMTGSGPTVFGLFSEQQTAQKAKAALEVSDISTGKIYLTELIGQS